MRWWLLFGLAGCNCDGPATAALTSAEAAEVSPGASELLGGPAAAAPSPSPISRPVVTAHGATHGATACSAPSLTIRGAIDARDDAAARRCESASVGAASLASRCGELDTPPIDLDAIDEAVLRFDEATEAHVRGIVAQGRALGRRAEVFGLVGDSMTVSGSFLQPLSHPERTLLAPAVERRIGGVIERYRGSEVVRVQGMWRDSFRAPRAAKVGARATWPLVGGAQSPLVRMVDEISPTTAFVLYGGNDAAYRVAPIAEIERGFRADLEAVVDALEERGVVPVLHTLARHGDAPGVDDCGGPSELSDWRIAVHTNALSAVVAQVACERRLPLIDLRWALDAADLRGLSADGIHPSTHKNGGGALDERTLRCGYNLRNYLTLRMLGALEPLVQEP
jgi:hypothetical protein